MPPGIGRKQSEETTIALYPNPVANNSRLLINAPASSNVNVQLYNQFGTPVGKQIDVTVDDSGEYQLPVKDLTLHKGAYILSVKIDGVRTIKRFVVE